MFDKIRIEDDSVRNWFRAVLKSQTKDAQSDSLGQRAELQRQVTLLVDQDPREWQDEKRPRRNSTASVKKINDLL